MFCEYKASLSSRSSSSDATRAHSALQAGMDSAVEPVPEQMKEAGKVEDSLAEPFADLLRTKNRFEQAYESIQQVVDTLAGMEGVSNAAMYPGFLFFSTYCLVRSKDLRKVWNEEVCRRGFLIQAQRLWPSLWNFDFLDDTKVATLSSEDMTAKFICERILYILWCSTDSSPMVCKEVARLGFLETLLEILGQPGWDAVSVQAYTERGYLYENLTAILHNCLRHNHDETKLRLRQANGIAIFKKFMTESTEDMVVTRAAIILARSVNEDELDLLKSSRNIFDYLVNSLLALALQTSARLSNGYCVEEIMGALNALAAHDENKLRMADTGILPLYQQVLTDPADELELERAVNGFWVLSFHPEVKKRIQALEGFTERVKALEEHANGLIQKAAKGIGWNVGGEVPGSAKAGTRAGRGGTGSGARQQARQAHIMISYDWGHQDLAKHLNNGLKEAGYRTWMDVDKMSGSTLEAMAEAVERATVVVMCISERYKDSNSCRSEAEYTYRLQKPIVPVVTQRRYRADGWLGILLGTKLYFDCSSIEAVDESLPKIVKELGVRGLISVQSDGELTTNGPAISRYLSKKREVLEWTTTEVESWLKECGLDRLCSQLAGYDGKLLNGLRALFIKSPSFFCQDVREELGLSSLKELLELANALESL